MDKERAPHPGFEIAGWLKTGGCIFVLALTVVGMALLFTSGRDPIEGYEPPESSQYYASHLPELKEELEARVFPRLDGVERCYEQDGVLVVVLSGQGYAASRAAILQYFDGSLFEFVTP